MSSKRKLILATAGVVAVAGAGTAIAASGHGRQQQNAAPAAAARGGWMFGAVAGRGRDHGRGDDLAAAASYLGVTTSQLLADLRSGRTPAQVASATAGKSVAGLVAALVAHEKQELAAAVTAGRLTQTQAEAVEATLQQRFTDFVDGVRPPFGGEPGFGHDGPDGALAAAASYLGVTPAALRADLRSGKTLAAIADATSGKSAAGLVAALVADAKAKLAAAASAGRLTQTQSDRIAATLQEHLTELVDGVRPSGPPPGRPDGPGGPGPRAGWWGGSRL
jgi:nitroreductase